MCVSLGVYISVFIFGKYMYIYISLMMSIPKVDKTHWYSLGFPVFLILMLKVVSPCCFMSIVSALIWKGVYICDFVFWLWYFFFLDLMIYNVLVLMQVDEEFDRYNMIGVGMKSWELFFRWCWAWGLSLTFVDLGSEEITLFVFHLGSLPHCWRYS